MLCFSAGISIATPLMSVVVSSGSTAMFTIILSTPGLSSIVNFDWRMGASSVMNGGQVSGADTNMLTISNVDTSHEGEYRVRMFRFSPEFCTTTSPTVTLTIRELHVTLLRTCVSCIGSVCYPQFRVLPSIRLFHVWYIHVLLKLKRLYKLKWY